MRSLIRMIGLLFMITTTAQAETVQVAVAANFAKPMEAIAKAFEAETGHQVSLSTGATGVFYAQIHHGAPFDVFLSADTATPARLGTEKLAISESAFTYALGKLVLWSSDPKTVDAQGAVLKTGTFKHLAIANPKTAPYGAAAMEVIDGLQLSALLAPRLVQGESIAQTLLFASSGAAELGFVALSQVYKDGQLSSGSVWQVPSSLYAPIRQDAILLAHGKHNQAATALMTFLKSEQTLRLIKACGYDLPAQH